MIVEDLLTENRVFVLIEVAEWKLAERITLDNGGLSIRMESW